MAAHAKLGASNAHMWLACPPSANINERAGERSSEYAREGTLAHELCELKVKKQFGLPVPMKPSEYRKHHNEIKNNELYKEEMEDCANSFTQAISEVALKFEERPFIAVEQRLDYSNVVAGGFGTGDAVVIGGDELHVFDYKHGKGVFVPVEDNPQMKLYAIGAYNMFNMFYPIKTVVLHIVQPRTDNIGDWSISVEDLFDWAENVVRPTAELADKGLGEFNPGEKQCRWCAINGVCEAQAKQAYELAKNDFFGAPSDTIPDDKIGELITLTRQISTWAKKLEDKARDKLLSGVAVAGYKMVEGRSSRDWIDFSVAFDHFKASGIDEALMWERVPLSVAKLEKVLDKKTFAQLATSHIVKKSGAPTLVPESDRRAQFVPAQEDFKQFIKGEENNE